MTPGFLAAASLALAWAAAAASMQADDPIEAHRRVLQANPNDAGAKVALTRMIDRQDPVPRDQDERIRDILRQYPWPGKASVTQADEPGQLLIVSGVVRDSRGTPIAGAIVNVFQTDANGHYTRAAVMDEPHARLFAYNRTGDDGRFEFTTIRPGAYPGRPDRQGEQWRIPEHVHFNVTAAGHPTRRFQMVFEDDARMTPFWRQWAARGQHPIVAVVLGRDGVQRVRCDITLREAADIDNLSPTIPNPLFRRLMVRSSNPLVPAMLVFLSSLTVAGAHAAPSRQQQEPAAPLSATDAFWAAMNGGDVARARAMYDEHRKADPSAPLFGEQDLNMHSYEMLESGRILLAIEAFRLNVDAYPASANTYDGLADGYLAAGNRVEALKFARKALEVLAADTQASEEVRAGIKESAERKVKQLSLSGSGRAG